MARAGAVWENSGMLPPTALHIGGLGLILGVLTFAQRLGAWENKHFARVAVLVAYAFGVAWLFFFVQERAAWICTVVLAVLFTWPIKGWLREYTVSRRGGAISKEVTKTPDSDVRSLEVRTNAPRVRVDYVDDGRAGGKGALVFKSDKPAIIQNVGDLISRERYESQHEFNLIPSPPSPIDVNSSIEYRMYGLRRRNSPDIRSLVDILRGGPNGNECVDSVVIDYD